MLGNLLSVGLPDGTLIEYIIDGRNRRIGKQVTPPGGAPQLVRKWLYKDGLNPVYEEAWDSATSTWVQTRFVYASRANVPDFIIRDNVTYRIIADHLGSPRLVINTTNGQVVQALEYDAWGNVLSDTYTGAIPLHPFSFAGGLYDADTELVRFGARDYDPATGRWTSKDPIRFDGDGPNLYGYVTNDPVNFVDPSGLLARAYHYDISYYAALKHGATPEQAHEFAQQVWAVDDGTQGTSPEETKYHYTAGDGQTIEDGVKAAEEFVNSPKTTLAQKTHALQDKAAPWHRGERWRGFGGFISYTPWMGFVNSYYSIKHIIRDGFPGDDVLQDALGATMDLLDKNNPWEKNLLCQ